jgi:hypothetical protein
MVFPASIKDVAQVQRSSAVIMLVEPECSQASGVEASTGRSQEMRCCCTCCLSLGRLYSLVRIADCHYLGRGRAGQGRAQRVADNNAPVQQRGGVVIQVICALSVSLHSR